MWATAAAEAAAAVKQAKKLQRGKKKPVVGVTDDQVDAYKLAEADVWAKYAAASDDPQAVLERAVRACPSSGMLWSRLLAEKASCAFHS